jgi:Transposase
VRPVGALEGTPASCGRRLGLTWPTAWAAVERHGRPLVEDSARVGETTQVGFDETVMSPARRRRRRWFLTAVVDIEVMSVNPHEGCRSAVTATDHLGAVRVVVDPFHIVRLANQALTRCRQRVQQQILGHRGWKGEPLYAARKLLLMAAETLDDTGWDPPPRRPRDR